MRRAWRSAKRLVLRPRVVRLLLRVQRRLEIIFGWLTEPRRRPILYLVMGLILVAALGIGSNVHERQVERHQRNAAIALAIKVQHAADAKSTEALYLSNLKSCRRGKPVRAAVRALALSQNAAYTTLKGFFEGAKPRALAQSNDPNITAASRTGAQKSVASITHAINVFSTKVAVPPPPPKCIDVITDPNAPATPHHN